MFGVVRAEPMFARWVAAESVSMVGTAVSTVVLPLLVYDLTGSASLTGAVFAVRAVPYLAFGLIAGPVADRGNRRRLIIGGNVAEGLLVATIPIAAALGALTVAHIFGVALLAATVFVFSDAAVFGAVPALVGTQRLPAANGLLGSLASAAEILGPVIGGVAVAAVGPSNALWIDAASFLGAAGVQTTIRSDFREGPVSASATARQHLGLTLDFVRRQRVVATLLLVGFGNSFAFGIVIGLLVPYALEAHGLGEEDARIGLLYAALGVGSLAAGLLFSRIFETRRVRVLTPGFLGMAAASAAALAIASGVVPAVLLLALFSVAIATVIIVGITYRQLAAPDHLRSSVNVLGRMIAWGGQPVGALTGAVLVNSLSVRGVYGVAAAVMGLSSAVAAVRLLPIDTSLPGDRSPDDPAVPDPPAADRPPGGVGA
jgi:MFS family permease